MVSPSRQHRVRKVKEYNALVQSSERHKGTSLRRQGSTTKVFTLRSQADAPLNAGQTQACLAFLNLNQERRLGRRKLLQLHPNQITTQALCVQVNQHSATPVSQQWNPQTSKEGRSTVTAPCNEHHTHFKPFLSKE